MYLSGFYCLILPKNKLILSAYKPWSLISKHIRWGWAETGYVAYYLNPSTRSCRFRKQFFTEKTFYRSV